ncbi:MAG: ABC transporter permease subunit [Vicinamibacterales bacterium]
MSGRRMGALIGKELREFRANPSAVVPVVLVILVCLCLPFVVLLIIPRVTGESIAADPVLQRAIAFAARHVPGLADLPPASAAEAFLFQQFLLLFLVAPIVGAVSLAAYSVVGEKQGRTLEALLTTPLTTTEILLAKVLAAFLPSLVIEVSGLLVYILLMAAFASPGVLQTIFNVRTALLVCGIGPFASLAALQATIAVSSRVNDPRSAQQIAVLLVLPLVAMLVGQVAGAFVVTTTVLALLTLALAGVWLLLLFLSVALFERESILTRWK